MAVLNVFKPFTKSCRYKVAYGGRGSGKSYNIAELLVEFARRVPLRILCARELQNSISDSVITILSDTIDRLGYQNEFLVLKNSIVHANGSRFLFYGIKNNPTKIKSLEGVDICWVEEAENVSEDSWQILIPTIRKQGSEIWVSFNPKNYLDATYQYFVVNQPKDALLLQVNWDKNKHISQTLLDEKDALKERDYDMYLHVWEGKPLADSAKAIIKYQWIEACIDLHKKLPQLLDGIKQLGVDVADEGADKNAIAYRKGSVLLELEEFGEGDTGETSVKAWAKATDYTCETIVYDSIGVGAGVKAKLNELKTEQMYAGTMNIIGFNASGAVESPNCEFVTGKTNAAMFSNLKAQAWWRLRERFQNTFLFVTQGKEFDIDEMISIDSSIEDLEVLMSELSTPLLDYDNNGRIKVESKKDLRKRGIKSPNKADSIVIAFYTSKQPVIGLIC